MDCHGTRRHARSPNGLPDTRQQAARCCSPLASSPVVDLFRFVFLLLTLGSLISFAASLALGSSALSVEKKPPVCEGRQGGQMLGRTQPGRTEISRARIPGAPPPRCWPECMYTHQYFKPSDLPYIVCLGLNDDLQFRDNSAQQPHLEGVEAGKAKAPCQQCAEHERTELHVRHDGTNCEVSKRRHREMKRQIVGSARASIRSTAKQKYPISCMSARTCMRETRGQQ